MAAGSALLLVMLAVDQLSSLHIAETPLWELPLLQPALMLIAGGLALGVALLLHSDGIVLPPPQQQHNRPLKTGRVRLLAVALGLLALLILTLMNGERPHTLLPVAHYHVQWILLLGGITALVWGLSQDGRWPLIQQDELLILTGITLLALGLRLWQLDTAVYRPVDEINFMAPVSALWEKPDIQILKPFADIVPSNVPAFTWLYPLLQNMSVGLFGSGLFALRFVSAVFGGLTIPALYGLAHLLFSRPVALLAALTLAAFPPHLHFSRLGVNNIADPLFGVLALAFLARGLNSNRRADYVLAGAMLGLTQYFYEGGRLLYPALAIGWFTLCGLAPRRAVNWRCAMTGLLVAVIIAIPVYYALTTNQLQVAARLQNTSLSLPQWAFLLTRSGTDAAQLFAERFGYPVLIYFAMQDTGWFYGGDQPLVLFALAPFFLLGLMFMLWRIRQPAGLLLVLWMALTTLGNAALQDNSQGQRFVVAFPALALLIALGLGQTFLLFWPRGLGKPQLRRWVLAGLIAALPIGQTIYYFGDHVPTFVRQFTYNPNLDDVLLRLPTLPPHTQVHVIVPRVVWEFDLLTFTRFFRLDIQARSYFPEEFTEIVLQSVNRDLNQAFFVLPDDTDTLARIRRFFTLGTPRFSPYRIPREQQLALYLVEVARLQTGDSS
jgi:4-amino-4-deoxy-L-arabinose transferase-like glycosyltransferase